MHSFFVFLIIGSCVGAVGGILTWLIMLQSQNERQTSTTSTSKVPETESTKSIPTAAIPPSQATSEYPEVDFEFKPEKVRPGDILSRPQKLILIVRDRGPSQLKQLKLRATQYQFDFDAIIPTKVTKLPDDKIRIEPGKYELAFNKRIPPATGTEQPLARSIKGHGGEKRIDLSVIKSFRFITPPKPGEPGGAGGKPLSGLAGESNDLRFYAIRFTFLDTGVNRRFCYYKVISCEEPYLLPFDNPSVSVIGESGRKRTRFRCEGEHHSVVNPNSIPF